MLRYMTIARIFLFLSIASSAPAAPIAVRRVREVHVNVVDGAEDGAVTSHKRWEPWDNWSTKIQTNAADQTSLPRTSALRQLHDLQDLDHLPRLSTESNNAPSSPAPSTGSLRDSPPPSGPSPGSTGHVHPPFYWSRSPDDSPRPDHSPTPALNLDRFSPSNPDIPLPSHLGRTLTPGSPDSWSTASSLIPGATDHSFTSMDYSPPSSPDPLPHSGLDGIHTTPSDAGQSGWAGKFSPSNSWSTTSSPILGATDHSFTSMDYSPPNSPDPLPQHGLDGIHMTPSDAGQSGWAGKFSPSSSWSPNFPPPGSWPEFSPSTDHPPSPAPSPDHHLLPSTSNPGYSAPNSWITDKSHSPDLGSPVYSPIPWVPDRPIISSQEYSLPSPLSTGHSPSSSADSSLSSSDINLVETIPGPTAISPLRVPQNPINPESMGFPSQPGPSQDPPRPTEPPEFMDILNQPGPSHDPPRPTEPPESMGFPSQPGPSQDLPRPTEPPEYMDILSQPGPSQDPPSEPSEYMDILSQPDPLRDPPSHAEPETMDFLSQLDDLYRVPPSPARPETVDFISQLGSSRGPSPAGPETMDLLGKLGPSPSHHAVPETIEFFSHFLNGKIKRRTPVSGSGGQSGAMNSALELEL